MLDVDTCSITILPNDTTIYSDTSIQLQLSTNQEASIYHWYPSTGLSDTTISNPVATISSTSQYILEAMFISDSNLVYNGDFELGNIGFVTDYNYETNPNPVFSPGDYNVVTNTNQVGSGFISCENGGFFFVTDASTDVSLTLYKNTANVEPNTDYLLSYESTTMYSQSPADLARLQSSINSQQIGNVLTVSNTNCNWSHFSGIWNSGTNTTATIRIKDQNSLQMGNDFAIDNISLRKICKAYDTINVTILPTLSNVDTCSITIHQNDTTIYSNTPIQFQLSTNQGADSYHWYPSTGLSDTTISNPVATISNSTQYILEAVYESDSNLVYNGDFEFGNIGFTTGLLLPSQSSSPYGTYILANNATSLYPGLCSCTHNGGFFMVADGSPNPTTTFQTQVNVEPNTDYKFSVELTNVNSSPYFIDSWRPIFQFSVNGDILGSPITVIRDCCSWNRFYQIWNSSNNTHATISIINLNISSEGNDFGLDNVSLRKLCKAYDTINIVINNSPIIPREIDIALCEKDFPYTYYDSVFTQAGTYGYSFTTNNVVDSLHIVNITLLPSYNDTIFASICSGEAYSENGFNVSDAGFYTNTLTTINGCDSIINLLLNVQSIEDTIINAVICEGTAYNSYGFNESNSGTYYNYYSFGEECERKVILNLTVIEYPEMLLLPDSIVDVEEYPITIDATCLGCSHYVWSNGVSSPVIDIYSQGTYYICAVSSCGEYCDSVVIRNPDIYVFLPNSFTPVESTNNIFRYYTANDEYIIIEAFQIFNRWGEKIFETNQKNIYWDGKYKGNYCPNGVYVWRLLYKTIFTGNQTFEKTGEVNLIK